MIWKTILVPHDFSSSANHATAIARDESKLHGARVLLLHIIDLPTAIKPDTVIVPDATGAPINVREYAVSSAEAHLQDIVARLAKDGVAARVERGGRLLRGERNGEQHPQAHGRTQRAGSLAPRRTIRPHGVTPLGATPASALTSSAAHCGPR